MQLSYLQNSTEKTGCTHCASRPRSYGNREI
jgi:hypothetical protein